jgi:conjugal transfer pilus assembly protein TraB
MAGIKGGSSPVRKKQMMLLGGLGAVVILVAVLAAMLGSPPKRSAPEKKEVPVRKQFGAQDAGVAEKDVWRTQEGARVTQLQDELKDLRDKLKGGDDARKNEETKRAESEKQKTDQEATRAAAAVVAQTNAPQGPPGVALPKQIGPTTGNPAGGPPRTSGQLGPIGPINGPSPRGVSGADGQPVEQVRGIVKFEVSSGGGAGNINASGGGNPTPGASSDGSRVNARSGGRPENADQDSNNRERGGRTKTSENYLPTGSFIRATNLAGLDAPTGGQVQQNPHPIVFRIIDLATLPNKFKADYKECFVTGNGYGDLSSERAMIRLDRLSCIAEDGAAIDVSVKGYVAGEDGKAGMRGRLISKQGSLLANALLAGIASGIGSGFAQSNSTVSTSPLGTTTTTDPGKVVQTGIGQGVGKALDKLAAYYITLAEKIFPIIEVDSGREVDIVITRGISIER